MSGAATPHPISRPGIGWHPVREAPMNCLMRSAILAIPAPCDILQRHKVNQDSAALPALLARISALELAIARLSERLQTVGAALSGSGPVLEKQPNPERAINPRKESGPGKTAERPAKSAEVSLPPEGTAVGSPSAVRKEPKEKAKSAGTVRQVTKGETAASANKWFKPGEAVQLLQGIVKKPMKFADVFKRVVSIKRKARLSPEEMGRFKWAVEAAVKKAVLAKALIRRGDGLIAVASADTAPHRNRDSDSAKKAGTKKTSVK